MIKTLTPSEMKQYESTAIHDFGVSADELMQKAAMAVAETVEEKLTYRKGRILCYCGAGNNGGDGLAAVRYLLSRHSGLTAEIYTLAGNPTLDFTREKDRLEGLAREGRVHYSETLPTPEGSLAIIDALFGTGLCRPLEGESLQAVAAINRGHALGIPVISVDIPSGINGETGNVMGAAVDADITITFHRPKIGLYLRDGCDHAGQIRVQDIGLHMETLLPYAPDGYAILTRRELARLLPPRRRNLHKGNCGKLLLLAGSFGMAGAAALAATAALRTGAGLVTVACPEKIVPTVQTLCPCATCLPIGEGKEAEDELAQAIPHFDAVGAGCGLGRSEWAKRMLTALLDAASSRGIPMVLDADALNHLQGKEWKSKGNCVITPHPAEAARLLGTKTEAVTDDPQSALEALQIQYNASVILKQACSLIVTEEGKAVNPYGCSAMAKGGSGDVLTGIIAALLAGRKAGLYAMSTLELLQCACALHGLAGEAARKAYGDRGVLATDLCQWLGKTNF